MTEARTRELLEENAALKLQWATLVGECPEGVDPLRYLRHLKAENRELREERGQHVYDRPSQSWE